MIPDSSSVDSCRGANGYLEDYSNIFVESSLYTVSKFFLPVTRDGNGTVLYHRFTPSHFRLELAGEVDLVATGEKIPDSSPFLRRQDGAYIRY